MQLKKLQPVGWLVLAMVSVIALGLVFWWGRQLRSRAGRPSGDHITAGLVASLQACLARRLPVFLPLSFLTGLLGINVGGIPGSDYSAAFAIVVALMVLVGVGQWLFFRWRKWF